ncbi:MAG: hypothetical protein QM688_10875 [Sphingomonas bacterium]
MRLARLLAALLASMSAPALAVTAEQARDLPEPELARLVLGEVGRMFVEVRRPDWQDGAFLLAIRPEEGKAPPLKWLTFYTRPAHFSFTGDARGEGICAARRMDVYFSGDGEVTSFQPSDIFGFAGAPGSAKAHPGEPEQNCASISAQHFFPAPPADIERVLGAMDQVRRAAVRGGAPWLRASCWMKGDCMASAGRMDFSQIRGIAPCNDNGRKIAAAGQCWAIDLGGAPCFTARSLEIVIADDRKPIRSAEFRDDRAIC